jgi:rare lipoprotein A
VAAGFVRGDATATRPSVHEPDAATQSIEHQNPVRYGATTEARLFPAQNHGADIRMNASSTRALMVIAVFVSAAPLALAQSPAPAAAVPAPAAATAPVPAAGAVEKGRLAWYGSKFAGRRTASGEPYDPNALTMAHKTLPFGTKVKVTNLANQRSVVLRVNDRGPTQADRVGDVSLAAAQRLGMVRAGVIDAELAVTTAPAAKNP